MKPSPHEKLHHKQENAETKKQNQDLPNIPASTSEIKKEQPADKQIHHTSKLQDDGKTDNTEKNEPNE